MLGANFFGPLVQAGFVLLKRDPDNQIATDNLTAELVSHERVSPSLAEAEVVAAKIVAQTIALSFDPWVCAWLAPSCDASSNPKALVWSAELKLMKNFCPIGVLLVEIFGPLVIQLLPQIVVVFRDD